MVPEYLNHNHCSTNANLPGYKSPGWYFYDEAKEIYFGPYSTLDRVDAAIDNYERQYKGC